MRKLIYAALVSALLLTLGCAITNYPVIFDSVGPWGDQVMHGQYDKAYIIPSSQVATIYADGSDELFSDVTQDWKGDQWIYTYNNFDPTASVLFLEQTYCDPNHQTECWITLAWNPDLPDAYPHGEEMGGPGLNGVDDVFDYAFDTGCSGARSLSLLVSYTSRIGECGSGVWGEPKQDAANEIANAEVTNFQGYTAYALPFNAANASIKIGSTNAPIYGNYNLFLTSDLQLAVQMTPNFEYQQRWLSNYIANHGSYLPIELTYGSMVAEFELHAMTR